MTNYEEEEASSGDDKNEKEGPAFFGVFDGHGGSAVAKYTGTTIHARLAALDSYGGFWTESLACCDHTEGRC